MQEQESIKAIPSNRLQFFPIMMFATIMGLGGLTLVYERMSSVFLFPMSIATVMIAISTILFFVVLIFYSLKLIKFKDEVKKEFTHPIRVNFFSSFFYIYVDFIY